VVCPNHTINWDVNWSPTTITGFDTYFAGCGTSSVDFNPESTKFTTIYPNPAADQTTLDFYLDNPAVVTLEAYNVTGQLVYSSTVPDVNPGFNYAVLPLSDFSNGVYVIKLIQDAQVMDVRMLSVTK
jgi:hypothetical protein